LVCYIRKYVIISGDIPVDVPPTKILRGCVPGIHGGVDASVGVHKDDSFIGRWNGAAPPNRKPNV